MTDKQFQLQRFDAQLLAAAGLLASGLAATGADGSDALDALVSKYPKAGMLAMPGIALLAKSKPVTLDEAISEPTKSELRGKVFVANLDRIVRLSRDLLKFAATPEVAAPAPESPFVPRVIEVDPDGNPIVEVTPETSPDGGSTFNLALTHDELHLIYWALHVAEAARDRQFNDMLQNTSTYNQLRSTKVTEDAFDVFVDKFEATHEQARIADGETH